MKGIASLALAILIGLMLPACYPDLFALYESQTPTQTHSVSTAVQVDSFTSSFATVHISLSARNFQAGAPNISLGVVVGYPPPAEPSTTQAPPPGGISITFNVMEVLGITLPDWQETSLGNWISTTRVQTRLTQNVSSNSWPDDNYVIVFFVASNVSDVSFEPSTPVGLEHYAGIAFPFNDSQLTKFIGQYYPPSRPYHNISTYAVSIRFMSSAHDVVSLLLIVPWGLLALLLVSGFGYSASEYLAFGIESRNSDRVNRFIESVHNTSIQLNAAVLLFIPFFLIALSQFAPPLSSTRYQTAVDITGLDFGLCIVLLIFPFVIATLRLWRGT